MKKYYTGISYWTEFCKEAWKSQVMLARQHKNEGWGCGPSCWAEVFAKRPGAQVGLAQGEDSGRRRKSRVELE